MLGTSPWQVVRPSSGVNVLKRNLKEWTSYTCKAPEDTRWQKKTEKFVYCKDQHHALEDKIFKNVTHVMFNLDGVVLNSERLIKEAHVRMLARYKKKYPNHVRMQVMGRNEDDAAAIIVKELELPISPATYNHALRQYIRRLMPKAQIVEGIRNLVCHLSLNKIPIGLNTMSTPLVYKYKVDRNRDIQPLLRSFCNITLGNEVKQGKPFPDQYKRAMQKFLIPSDKARTVLAIEDSIAGVRAAKAAGMQVIMLPDPETPQKLKDEASLAVKKLTDIDLTEFGLPELPFLKEY